MSWLARGGRALAAYPRRSPLTTSYLAVLLSAYALVDRVLPQATADRLLRYASTNLDNLARHPATSLLASALFIVGPLFDLDTILIVGVGIGVCMAWAERRHGSLYAAAVFLLGHVGTTLLTVPVLLWGIAAGRYAPAQRHAFDYGVSYGAITVTAAVAALLPGWARPLWAAVLVGYPLHAATWSGLLPDFGTVGHLIAALLGFVIAARAARRAKAARNAPEPHGTPPSR